jgi:hypothetical protein
MVNHAHWQVEAKQLALQREAQERSADAALHEAAHARMERRHCDDMRRRQESTSAVKQSLDQQIAAKRERQDAEAQQAAKEAAALRDEWARLQACYISAMRRTCACMPIMCMRVPLSSCVHSYTHNARAHACTDALFPYQAEAEAAEAADRERERQLADEVRAYNKLRLLQLSKVENEERQADLALLNAALAREAQEEAADAAAREERHQAVRHYRQQVSMAWPAVAVHKRGHRHGIYSIWGVLDALQLVEVHAPCVILSSVCCLFPRVHQSQMLCVACPDDGQRAGRPRGAGGLRSGSTA